MFDSIILQYHYRVMPANWTIDELAANVVLALSRMAVDQPSGRVRQVPTPRAIRYYTTYGLLDPPIGFRGRTALYGARHLAQLVAVKKLQARGLPLEQIQQRLLGLDEASLFRFAGLEESSDARRRSTIWKAFEPVAGSSPSSARPDHRTAPTPNNSQIDGVRLGPNLLLLLEQASRPIDDEDLQAIRVAASPLLKLLRARRLLVDNQEQ